MLKFDILNRFSGSVQFTAEIACSEDTLPSIKLGLAVKAAVAARANLADANLAGAYLAGAYLAGAYLAGAYLARANLAGAYLAGAYLARALWRDGIKIERQPIYVEGLTPYRVVILDQHMQIGCELHSLADWAAFDDRRIIEMDGRAAATFWRDHKAPLLGIAKAAGRNLEPVVSRVAA